MFSTMSRSPEFPQPSWAKTTRAGAELWRVADERGRPLGHVRAVSRDGAWRYRAERYQSEAKSFRAVGEFWAAADAFDCLRYQR